MRMADRSGRYGSADEVHGRRRGRGPGRRLAVRRRRLSRRSQEALKELAARLTESKITPVELEAFGKEGEAALGDISAKGRELHEPLQTANFASGR